MKTLLKFLCIALLFPALFTFQVFAKEPGKQTMVTLEKNEVVNRDYFAAGDTVIVSGTVNGDAYVAGGSVIVDGTINGDLLVAAGSLQVRGPVKNNIRAAGGTITISSRVGGNMTIGGGNVSIADTAILAGSVVAGAGNLEIFAPVGKGMTIGGGNVLIANKIGGDVMAGVGQLTLLRGASIKGNLAYWSSEDAKLMDGAIVGGELTKHAVPKTDWRSEKMKVLSNQNEKAAKAALGITVLWVVSAVVFMFILGVVLIKLLPAFTTKTLENMQKKPWQALGIGLITTIVLPVVAFVLLFTIIGIPVSIVIFFGLGILYIFADLYASLFTGERVLGLLKLKPHRAWQLLAGIVLLTLVMFVPVIGLIVKTGLILIATGAFITQKLALYREMRSRNVL